MYLLIATICYLIVAILVFYLRRNFVEDKTQFKKMITIGSFLMTIGTGCLGIYNKSLILMTAAYALMIISIAIFKTKT